MAPHVGHVSNLRDPLSPLIEPMVAHCFESDPCELLAHVHDRYPVWTRLELAKGAHEVIRVLELPNVTILHGDGSLGWRPNAPYDGIIVAAASPSLPKPLVEQLVAGGRLVIPIGPREVQCLTLITRHPEGEGYDEAPIDDVRFVPLLGELGFAGAD